MDLGKLKAVSDDIAGGEWVDGLPGFGDGRLLVRGINSTQAVRLYGRLARAAGDADRDADGQLTEAAEARIDRRVICEAVLLGWENLTEDGAPLEYSPEAAARLMEMDLFESIVRNAMMQVSVANKARIEALAGNLPAPLRRRSKAAK